MVEQANVVAQASAFQQNSELRHEEQSNIVRFGKELKVLGGHITLPIVGAFNTTQDFCIHVKNTLDRWEEWEKFDNRSCFVESLRDAVRLWMENGCETLDIERADQIFRTINNSDYVLSKASFKKGFCRSKMTRMLRYPPLTELNESEDKLLQIKVELGKRSLSYFELDNEHSEAIAKKKLKVDGKISRSKIINLSHILPKELNSAFKVTNQYNLHVEITEESSKIISQQFDRALKSILYAYVPKTNDKLFSWIRPKNRIESIVEKNPILREISDLKITISCLKLENELDFVYKFIQIIAKDLKILELDFSKTASSQSTLQIEALNELHDLISKTEGLKLKQLKLNFFGHTNFNFQEMINFLQDVCYDTDDLKFLSINLLECEIDYSTISDQMKGYLAGEESNDDELEALLSSNDEAQYLQDYPDHSQCQKHYRYFEELEDDDGDIEKEGLLRYEKLVRRRIEFKLEA